MLAYSLGINRLNPLYISDANASLMTLSDFKSKHLLTLHHE
ncbi:hypothetical protein LDVICp063 [lymphocystis disease virus-China]|uniref:Uncharacterized protein n=1 Tax=lymphocystis disease virus-China TaxID=256729 RepID=Q678E8_9VIRU|nr:hypothetical protein LDVICp063 [lymphocystis disease virus-China]AAU10909.1 hypothetical protein [lymphocystis disease virus-China]